MKIEQCAFFSKETLIGNPSCGTCNIFTQDELLLRRYIPCEAIPISKCPYKMFKEGLITKEELNNEVKKLVEEN